MPYEDDYKMWLEKMLIESNPDWVCDGMYDMGFTHEWCKKYCGEDSEYVTPKCLHMYYHHIVMADRKTEPQTDWKDEMWTEAVEGEPQTEKGGCTNCDGKDLCNNAFTEISQYCGAYEPQNGYQTFNGTSVYVSRLEDEPQTERSE